MPSKKSMHIFGYYDNVSTGPDDKTSGLNYFIVSDDYAVQTSTDEIIFYSGDTFNPITGGALPPITNYGECYPRDFIRRLGYATDPAVEDQRRVQMDMVRSIRVNDNDHTYVQIVDDSRIREFCSCTKEEVI